MEESVINFIDILLQWIFPWRSGNHQATIKVNSFTAWTIEQAFESKMKDHPYIIHQDDSKPYEQYKILTLVTPFNNVLRIERDDSLKNMEVKTIKP